MYHSFLIHLPADGTFSLLPCPGYYKQCCNEHWGTRVSFNSDFLNVYAQKWNCWAVWQFYFQFFCFYFVFTLLIEVWHACMLNCVGLSAIPWIAAWKSPLSMGFSKQEYWSGLPFPFPGDLPDPGIKPRSLALQTDFFPTKPPVWKR